MVSNVLKWIFNLFIDIKSDFNYNYDDTGDINLGLNNNDNIKKRNINIDGAD